MKKKTLSQAGEHQHDSLKEKLESPGATEHNLKF